MLLSCIQRQGKQRGLSIKVCRSWWFPFTNKYKTYQNCWKQPFQNTRSWLKADKKLEAFSFENLTVVLLPEFAPSLPLSLHQMGRKNSSFVSLGLTAKPAALLPEVINSNRNERQNHLNLPAKMADLIGNGWGKPTSVQVQGCHSNLEWMTDHSETLWRDCRKDIVV